jgi:hypothetical protein
LCLTSSMPSSTPLFKQATTTPQNHFCICDKVYTNFSYVNWSNFDDLGGNPLSSPAVSHSARAPKRPLPITATHAPPPKRYTRGPELLSDSEGIFIASSKDKYESPIWDMLSGEALRGASNSSGSTGSLKSPGKIEIDICEGAKSIAVVYTRINASWWLM